MIILSRYNVKVYGANGRLILEASKWGKNVEDAEQKTVEYIEKSTFSVYEQNAPLRIVASLKGKL